VNVGDLIKIGHCDVVEGDGVRMSCGCFLCDDESNRVGLVIDRSKHPAGRWLVLFDVGTGWVNDGDLFTICS